MPVGGLINAFWASNAAGQVIVAILFIGSILAWSSLVTKWKCLGDARGMSQRFLKAYRQEGTPAGLFMKRQRYEPSPMYSVYDKVCKALGAELGAQGADSDDLFMGSMSAERRMISGKQVAAVQNVAAVTLSEAFLALEGRRSDLSIAANAAPLLGLLGTAWGLLDAFGGMGVANEANLSVLVSGISGALLPAVVGFLVAVPSAIGRSLLVERIRTLRVSSDSFVEELLSDVERNYLDHGKA
jgi:biopolymer transport protein TolQ